VLAYFGEAAEPCGACDLCDAPPETFDATEAVRKALSAILRTGESFGAGHLIDVLTGRMTDKVRDRGHASLPTFGVGRDLSTAEWQAVFRQMTGRDLIRPDPERQGAFRMTGAARPILRGEEGIVLRRDTIRKAVAKPVVRTLVAEEDAALLSALKAKRRALAEAARVPAYVIFPDRSLIEMAEARPATPDQMARVSGVGAKKLESYGAAFLEVITGAPARAHPARLALAGRDAGSLYDRLAEAQARLERGADGLGKLMSCTPAALRRIAETRPRDLIQLARVGGFDPAKLERFGAAFLRVLAEG
jgi:ATP-dependent DNA helicase RecQ